MAWSWSGGVLTIRLPTNPFQIASLRGRLLNHALIIARLTLTAANGRVNSVKLKSNRSCPKGVSLRAIFSDNVMQAAGMSITE